MIARPAQPRMMRTAMHHGMTTVASAVLVAVTMPGKLAWMRLGGYLLYWVTCAVAFVPVVRASDWLALAFNRRFKHVATDEVLHEELLQYQVELDRAIREGMSEGSTAGVDPEAKRDDRMQA